MGKVCIVKSCPSGRKIKNRIKNTRRACQPISFFQPTAKARLVNWQMSLGIALKTTDNICHLHFKSEHVKMFEKLIINGETRLFELGKKVLLEEALPTVEHQFIPISEQDLGKIIIVEKKLPSPHLHHSQLKDECQPQIQNNRLEAQESMDSPSVEQTKSAETWPLCVGTQIDNRYSENCKGVVVGDNAYKRCQKNSRCEACRILRINLQSHTSDKTRGHSSTLLKQCKHLNNTRNNHATSIEHPGTSGLCVESVPQVAIESVYLPDVLDETCLIKRPDHISDPCYVEVKQEFEDESGNEEMEDKAQNTWESDDIDNLFLSYKEAFKMFSSKIQAMLKLDLANLFARYEMRNHAHLETGGNYKQKQKKKEFLVAPPDQSGPPKPRLMPMADVKTTQTLKPRKRKLSQDTEDPISLSVAVVTPSAKEEKLVIKEEPYDAGVSDSIVPIIITKQQPVVNPLQVNLQNNPDVMNLSKCGGNTSWVAQTGISESFHENLEKHCFNVIHSELPPNTELAITNMDGFISLDPEFKISSLDREGIVDGADFVKVKVEEIHDVGS